MDAWSSQSPWADDDEVALPTRPHDAHSRSNDPFRSIRSKGITAFAKTDDNSFGNSDGWRDEVLGSSSFTGDAGIVGLGMQGDLKLPMDSGLSSGRRISDAFPDWGDSQKEDAYDDVVRDSKTHTEVINDNSPSLTIEPLETRLGFQEISTQKHNGWEESSIDSYTVPKDEISSPWDAARTSHEIKPSANDDVIYKIEGSAAKTIDLPDTDGLPGWKTPTHDPWSGDVHDHSIKSASPSEERFDTEVLDNGQPSPRNSVEGDDFGDFGDYTEGDAFDGANESDTAAQFQESSSNEAVTSSRQSLDYADLISNNGVFSPTSMRGSASRPQSVQYDVRPLDSAFFVVNVKPLEKLFPKLPESGNLENITDVISSTSARRTWYRLTREEASRHAEINDDKIRVKWEGSKVQAKVYGIVDKWICEDRLHDREFLGSSMQSGSFGWNDNAVFGDAAGKAAFDRFSNARPVVQHQKKLSGQLEPIVPPKEVNSPTLPTFGWASTTSPKASPTVVNFSWSKSLPTTDGNNDPWKPPPQSTHQSSGALSQFEVIEPEVCRKPPLTTSDQALSNGISTNNNSPLQPIPSQAKNNNFSNWKAAYQRHVASNSISNNDLDVFASNTKPGKQAHTSSIHATNNFDDFLFDDFVGTSNADTNGDSSLQGSIANTKGPTSDVIAEAQSSLPPQNSSCQNNDNDVWDLFESQSAPKPVTNKSDFDEWPLFDSKSSNSTAIALGKVTEPSQLDLFESKDSKQPFKTNEETKEEEEDFDDWGEMVSSPTETTNADGKSPWDLLGSSSSQPNRGTQQSLNMAINIPQHMQESSRPPNARSQTADLFESLVDAVSSSPPATPLSTNSFVFSTPSTMFSGRSPQSNAPSPTPERSQRAVSSGSVSALRDMSSPVAHSPLRKELGLKRDRASSRLMSAADQSPNIHFGDLPPLLQPTLSPRLSKTPSSPPLWNPISSQQQQTAQKKGSAFASLDLFSQSQSTSNQTTSTPHSTSLDSWANSDLTIFDTPLQPTKPASVPSILKPTTSSQKSLSIATNNLADVPAQVIMSPITPGTRTRHDIQNEDDITVQRIIDKVPDLSFMLR